MKYKYYIIKLTENLKYVYRTEPGRKYVKYCYKGNRRWIRSNMTRDFLEKHYSTCEVPETDVFLELL